MFGECRLVSPAIFVELKYRRITESFKASPSLQYLTFDTCNEVLLTLYSNVFSQSLVAISVRVAFIIVS